MPILWDQTKEIFGTDELSTKAKEKVIVACDKCRIVAERVYCSIKQGMKKNNGLYLCHTCSIDDKFKAGCSERAKIKWQDPEYRSNNLTAVRSTEYRLKKKLESEQRWQDPEFRAFMMSPEISMLRQRNSRIAAKRKWQDPKYRAKLIQRIRERMLKQWRNQDYRDHILDVMSNSSKQRWDDGAYDGVFDDNFRIKMTNINQEILSRPEVLSKLSEAGKRNWENKEYREAIIRGNAEKWQDPKYRKKMAIVRANQPGVSSLQKTLYSYLNGLNIEFFEEGENTAIGYYVFDCLVPKQNDMRKNLLIECQGDYWHSLEHIQSRDRAKFTYINRYFPEHEVMYLWEHEFYTNGRILDRLKLKLGLGIKTVDFDFRDLEVTCDFKKSEVRQFLDSYHYIGRGRGGITIGVRHADELVGIAIFSPPLRQNQQLHGEFRELSRFCIHPNYHKKNFGSWFLSRAMAYISDVSKIIAYADSTVGHDGGLYRASNFKLSHETSPDYWYVDSDGYVMHKRTLYGRASKMKMTEKEFAKEYGYNKKYGGPKNCYVYEKQNASMV